jgi:hypothetical protein
MAKAEYKILQDTAANVQKTLNQWRHSYSLQIHNFESHPGGEVCVLLTREEIPPPRY